MTRDSLRRAATAQAATPEERAEDERLRFITANAELAHLTVRQGYALRVLRGAALALVGAVDRSDAAEGAAAHDDTGTSAAEHGAAGVAWTEALAALREALDNSEEDAKAAETAHQQLVAERDAAREEVASLRAIVDGSTEPPTEAEIAAHEAAGGRWRWVVTADGEVLPGRGADGERWPDVNPIGSPRRVGVTYVARWWALDSTGRPCARRALAKESVSK